MFTCKNIYLAQAEEIQKHRWIESKKAGCDVGELWAARDWIRKYAKTFRENWNKTRVIGK